MSVPPPHGGYCSARFLSDERMPEDVVIRADELGKRYLIGHHGERESYTALRDVLARGARTLWRKTADIARGRALIAGEEIEEFWALKDVNFEVKRGEVLGIIGSNGAGKSTLLKILSRITESSKGRVTIRGRVASLLEVGTGFHPELTGRENIYLNGAILGMTRAEIKKKLDEIVAFAGVEKFIDTPVKRYSSGMQVRLGFAVAAHLEPEILILDEVLAVGDAEFQKRCFGKMSQVASGGRTVLFVTHDMDAVEALCPRSLLLTSGTLVNDGDTRTVVTTYLGRYRTETASRKPWPSQIEDGLLLRQVRLSSQAVRANDFLEIRIDFSASAAGCLRECTMLINSVRGPRLAIVDARDGGAIPLRYEPGIFSIIMHIPGLPFVAGYFTLDLLLVTDGYGNIIKEVGSFAMLGSMADLVLYPAEVRGYVSLKAATRIAYRVFEAEPINIVL